ncbi:hypothetical protein MHYMCMPSP_00798 [Hyalomma marginatum]|uniref:Uncharacterized protein n=1 Tax=Hyalomma marginatum TaxID=34627 RepID=A0A8S4C2C2_9ACAR|nr:hypothetical protein MHYMCMPASI_00585 [Hyalomma marginatum]CAG7593404.1 hypothetical protein MHYMCMPSP_00798 [Hyalomma marginatum]
MVCLLIYYTVIIIGDIMSPSLIELYPGKQFVLCGSSARRLKATGTNLLGGRAWRFLFLPFCTQNLRS